MGTILYIYNLKKNVKLTLLSFLGDSLILIFKLTQTNIFLREEFLIARSSFFK